MPKGVKKGRPPMYRSKGYHVLSKYRQPITIEKLDKMLALIGWRVRHVGCDYYRIMNHLDRPTVFELRGNGKAGTGEHTVDVTMRNDQVVFGAEYGGSFTADLWECQLEIAQGDTIFIYAQASEPKANAMCIFLNNHWQEHGGRG